jgi:hypothetical protein
MNFIDTFFLQAYNTTNYRIKIKNNGARQNRRVPAELTGTRMTCCAPQNPARTKSFERTPPTNRGFRLAGAYGGEQTEKSLLPYAPSAGAAQFRRSTLLKMIYTNHLFAAKAIR